MRIDSITVYLSSLSETVDREYECFVVGKLTELHPDPEVSIRVYSQDGRTQAWVITDTGERMGGEEHDIQELCACDWWQEFCQADRASRTWRPEDTTRGY